MFRKSINFEEIVKQGIALIKSDTDMIYECNEKEKAELAIRISAIIDFITQLDDATQLIEEVKE